MKLLVGLGNPGKKYEGTRHNIGFEALTAVARRYQAGERRAKFEGEWAEAQIASVRVGLLWPLTYMNLSGGAVLAARDFYKIEPEDLLVICDDLSLPRGKLRFRAKGSSGGQKGLDDILRRLGSEQVPRLRIGIDAAPPGWDAADYVLARFSRDERVEVDRALDTVVAAAADWVAQGIAFCMNKYNAN
jgi:PTH1 family peptidyl-tRNA hydrolase